VTKFRNIRDDYRKLCQKLKTAKDKVDLAIKDLETDYGSKKKELIQKICNFVQRSISEVEEHAKNDEELVDSTISSAGMRIDKDAVGASVRAAT